MAIKSFTVKEHELFAPSYEVGEYSDRFGSTPARVKEIRPALDSGYLVLFDTPGHDCVFVSDEIVESVTHDE